MLAISACALSSVAPFAGAWIEIHMLGYRRDTGRSHPSRVRGLKYEWKQAEDGEQLSHPSRVRGLKYV